MTKLTKNQTVPVRLDDEQIAKLDEIAKRQFNTRNGMIRMGIDMLIRSMPPEESETPAPPTAEPQPEPVVAA